MLDFRRQSSFFFFHFSSSKLSCSRIGSETDCIQSPEVGSAESRVSRPDLAGHPVAQISQVIYTDIGRRVIMRAVARRFVVERIACASERQLLLPLPQIADLCSKVYLSSWSRHFVDVLHSCARPSSAKLCETIRKALLFLRFRLRLILAALSPQSALRHTLTFRTAFQAMLSVLLPVYFGRGV